jgi:hypothetical protein
MVSNPRQAREGWCIYVMSIRQRSISIYNNAAAKPTPAITPKMAGPPVGALPLLAVEAADLLAEAPADEALEATELEAEAETADAALLLAEAPAVAADPLTDAELAEELMLIPAWPPVVVA